MKNTKSVSICCNANVISICSDEGTGFYQCTQCKSACDVAWDKSQLDSLSNIVEKIHKKQEERFKVLYPTGIIPIHEEEIFYHKKSIEEKMEMIHAKLNEVIEYLNVKKA